MNNLASSIEDLSLSVMEIDVNSVPLVWNMEIDIV